MSAAGNPGACLLGDSTQHAADGAAILATCFGNRSAAFYNLGNVEVLAHPHVQKKKKNRKCMSRETSVLVYRTVSWISAMRWSWELP